MNPNAMKALCHGGRRAQIYNTLNGGQWISNGFGAWLVDIAVAPLPLPAGATSPGEISDFQPGAAGGPLVAVAGA